MCSVSLILKWGGRELLIPHSDKVLPPFVLAMIISLRCLQRTKTIYTALVEMATHSSILGWKIPWTEEPGGLQSMGSQRVGHD